VEKFKYSGMALTNKNYIQGRLSSGMLYTIQFRIFLSFCIPSKDVRLMYSEL
jgi:hypothetical protein